MNGRLEHDKKIQDRINKKLDKLPQCVKDWYYNLRASDLSVTSCDMYINKIKLFLQFYSSNIKNIDLTSIKQETVDQYFISIKTKEKDGDVLRTSDSHQQVTWCALNSFFNFLVNRGYIKKNFMEQINKPKNRDLDRINKERKLLTAKDFKKIMEAVEKDWIDRDRNTLVMALFMETGMRLSALISINNKDIDMEKRIIRIIDKGDKIHEYYITDTLKEYIEEYDHFKSRDRMLRGYDYYDEDALFIDKKGQRITRKTVCNIVYKYSEKALGYAISPHKLRAGFCSILYDKTHDAEFVRRAVGHMNLATTQRYIVTDGKEKEKAANIIGNILSSENKEEESQCESEYGVNNLAYFLEHPDRIRW